PHAPPFSSYLPLAPAACAHCLSGATPLSLPLFFPLLLSPPPRSTLFPYTTLFRSPGRCRIILLVLALAVNSCGPAIDHLCTRMKPCPVKCRMLGLLCTCCTCRWF